MRIHLLAVIVVLLLIWHETSASRGRAYRGRYSSSHRGGRGRHGSSSHHRYNTGSHIRLHSLLSRLRDRLGAVGGETWWPYIYRPVRPGTEGPGAEGSSSGPERQAEWWDGPNVCTSKTDRNETLEGESIEFNSVATSVICNANDQVYMCTTSVTEKGVTQIEEVLKQCCQGHSRQLGDHGCPSTESLEPLTKTLRQLNLTELLQAIGSVGLDEVLDSGNITVFAPLDMALLQWENTKYNFLEESYPSMVVVDDETEAMVDDVEETLLSHVVATPLRIGSLANNQVLQTVAGDSTIRINIYFRTRRPVVTANCARVVSRNVATSGDGIVHTVEKVLTPVTQTVNEIIESRPDLSEFAKGLSLIKGSYKTVFAFTNAALEQFRQLHPARASQLENSLSCATELVKNHFAAGFICSAGLQGRHRVRTLAGTLVPMRRDGEGEILLGQEELGKIVQADIVAADGVIHVIDNILVPDSIKDQRTAVMEEGGETLQQLFDWTGYRMPDNITLFVPTERAVQRYLEQHPDIQSNEDALKNMILYHAAKGARSSHQLKSRDKLRTEQGATLTVRNYRNLMSLRRPLERTVQCARVVKSDIQTCSATIHVIDRVLILNEKDIMETLRSQPNFSRFVELLEQTELEQVLSNGTFTVLPVSNDVLTDTHLPETPDHLKKQMQLHILPGAKCCTAFTAATPIFGSRVKNLAGIPVPVHQTHSGRIKIGLRNHVTACDQTATNGVIHELSGLINPMSRYGQAWD